MSDDAWHGVIRVAWFRSKSSVKSKILEFAHLAHVTLTLEETSRAILITSHGSVDKQRDFWNRIQGWCGVD